jgi:hypothetical protein
MCKQAIINSGTGFPCQAILQMNAKTEKSKSTCQCDCKEQKKWFEEKTESQRRDIFIPTPLKNRFIKGKSNAENANREDNPEIRTMEKLDKEELRDRGEVRKLHRSSESTGNHGIRGKIEDIHGLAQR